jgi:hypothetical protein
VLSRLDAALHRRSLVAWIIFRAIAGLLVAVGLLAWLGVWFERHFWLGAAQAAMCVLVLARELDILPHRLGDRRQQ